MASVGSLAPSRPSARRVARKRRPPARRARRLPARASSASSGRATSDAPDVVAVRYGLLNGSVAYYPRSDASSPSSPSARRRDTAPTTRYDDGPLDAAAIALFNAAAITEQAERTEKAIDLYESVIKRYKKSPQATESHMVLGLLYESQTNFETAASYFEKMASFPDVPQMADALYNAGSIRVVDCALPVSSQYQLTEWLQV